MNSLANKINKCGLVDFKIGQISLIISNKTAIFQHYDSDQRNSKLFCSLFKNEVTTKKDHPVEMTQ